MRTSLWSCCRTGTLLMKAKVHVCLCVCTHAWYVCVCTWVGLCIHVHVCGYVCGSDGCVWGGNGGYGGGRICGSVGVCFLCNGVVFPTECALLRDPI